MSYPPPPPPGGYGGPTAGGAGGSPPYQGPPPANNMAMSIGALVVSLLCGGCFPLGIVAVVMSAQVNGKWGRGDAAGAAKSARTARTVSIVSFVVSALVFVGVVIYFATASGDTTY